MTETPRYTAVAIILHWAIGLMLIGMIFFGWYMDDLRQALRAGAEGVTLSEVQFAYNAHKTTGMIVLVLSLARLGWRLTHKVPPMPERMAGWERRAASATHIALYVLMIGMPLLGWIAASTTQAPSLMFNNPALVLPHLPVPQDRDFHELAEFAHSKGAWAIIVLAGLHFAAALKHQFLDKDGLIGRMLPFFKG